MGGVIAVSRNVGVDVGRRLGERLEDPGELAYVRDFVCSKDFACPLNAGPRLPIGSSSFRTDGGELRTLGRSRVHRKHRVLSRRDTSYSL